MLRPRSAAAALALTWLGWSAAGVGASPATVSGTDASSRGRADAPVAGEVCEAEPTRAKLNYTLKDLAGRKVKLADFKGKVIALNFWATWGAPCKKEIPEFVELQAHYGEQGLQFVGISVDDPLEKLKPYVAAMDVNYPVLQGRGQERILDAFSPPIQAVPVTILIRRDGSICKRHVGFVRKSTLESTISALLSVTPRSHD